MRFLGVGILFATMSGACFADCRNHAVVAVRQQVAVVTPALVAVPVVVPAYSISYSPSGAEFEELRKRVAELEKGGKTFGGSREPIPAPQPTTPDDAVLILRRDCAKCHTAPNEKGSFAIFDADGSLMPGLNKSKVFYQAHKGLMPKGGKALSDADVDLLLEWMNR